MFPEDENSQGSEETSTDSLEEGSPVESGIVPQQEEDKHNPAWDSLLESMPSSLHSTITPHLKQWDRNYQDGINKVHSQYESYKPYVENNVTREQIDYALQIMQAIETRPQDMIKALQDYTGMSKAEATAVVADEQGQVETEVPEELFNHPKFLEMQKMVQTVAQHLVTQKQQEESTAQDKALATELEGLKETHGDYDEEFVLTLAMANPDKSLEDCVLAYKAKVTEMVEKSRRAPAPKVLGQGGGAPDNQMQQSDLKDPKNRKAVIAQMLAASQST